jgi:hypothetical protein
MGRARCVSLSALINLGKLRFVDFVLSMGASLTRITVRRSYNSQSGEVESFADHLPSSSIRFELVVRDGIIVDLGQTRHDGEERLKDRKIVGLSSHKTIDDEL